MNPRRIQRIMRAEIDTLRREGLVDAQTYQDLRALYPTTPWDFSSLSRWFLIFGAVAFIAGVIIMGAEIFRPTLPKLAVLLGVLISGCFYVSWILRARDLAWTRRSIELVGGIAIIGLTFTLGIIFSSGSGNWPALLLIDLFILLPLTYLLRNVLLLVVDMVVFFVWFGGVTGYISGWGAYFFGMNYPVRFLLAGIAIAGVGVLHRRAERHMLRAYEGFFRAWLASGVFFSEMALWLMSLFGNYGSIFSYHLETAGELILFNSLWAGFNGLLFYAGIKLPLRMLRGYAITFLIIHAYTLYFWQIAEHLGPILATFVAGGVTLGLVMRFEANRRERTANVQA
jgi:hypothetical protein